MFAAYASRHGHAFVDRALYLPKAWTDDPARLAAADVPAAVRFATKPKLAMAMIERAVAAQVPFSWLAADTVYGTGDVEMALRRAGKGYVLSTNANHPFGSGGKTQRVSGTAEAIARELPDTAWTRLSAGEGTRGARLHDWHYLPLADLYAGECDGPPGPWTPGPWTRGLLVRRHVADRSMAFFSTWCPLGTSLETLVAVAGRRWTTEDAFEPPRTSSASTTTRRAPATAGTATSPSSLPPSPCWPRSVITPTRPKKGRCPDPAHAAPAPMIDAGTPHRRGLIQ